MTIRPRDRAALGVVALIALVAAFYVLVLTPQRKHAKRLTAEIATQQSSLTSAQTDYAKGKAAEESLTRQAASWAALRKAVPNSSDIPALLRLLQRDADAAGVGIQSIQLSGTSTGATATAATASTTGASTTAASTTPTSVPLQLTFTGGYAALNALVKRLDGLVVVHGQSVRASGPLLTISGVTMNSGKSLTVAVSANIYQLSAGTSADTTSGGTS